MTNDIALRQDAAVARWVPSTGRLLKISEYYAAAGLCPNALRGKPQDVFIVITTGIELGMAPASALRAIHVVQGRPCLSADLMAGLAMSAGATFEYLEQSDKVCRINWKRGGSSGVVGFTWEDAERAKLTGKDNWKQYPAAMLAARCKALAARQAAPDLLAGLYDRDEIEHIPATFETEPEPERKPEPPKLPRPKTETKAEKHKRVVAHLWASAGALNLKGKVDGDSVVLLPDEHIFNEAKLAGCDIVEPADGMPYVVGKQMSDEQIENLAFRLDKMRNEKQDQDALVEAEEDMREVIG